MRYIDSSKKNAADKWDGRIRLNVKGQVNDATYVQGQFVNEMNFKDEETSNTKMAQIYVNHNCIRILSPHLRWGTRWSRSFA